MHKETADELPNEPGLRIESAELVRALLMQTAREGASDLHLKTGAHPVIRLHGQLTPLTQYAVLDGKALEAVLEAVATPQQRDAFAQSHELDFAYSLDERSRFRVNVALQRGSVSIAFRVVPRTVPPWSSLGIPDVCKDLVRRRSGLVLVTGPTGSGKSTTLAAMIDYINGAYAARVVTIEDPIEFVHEDRLCHVIQREVGSDTLSFTEGLRRALRQDPDVILIGEMRDLDTISTAITAAETGHLVLATLHTPGAAQTVERVTDVFPASQQTQVRLQFSAVLIGIVSQRLLKRIDQPGRAAAFEVMVATPAIRNLVREQKLHEIPSYISMGAQYGMRTLEQSLADMVRRGVVDLEEAREVANVRSNLEALIGPGGAPARPSQAQGQASLSPQRPAGAG